MLRPALALSLIAASACALALPLAANAAPTRAPLAAQQADGPTLHPSGKDRYVEAGGSGTQGKAQSDPDGTYNYGVDQTGGTGGLYLSDQDGNNGCGNDQDFEDDNNGNCGKARPTCPVTMTGSYELKFADHGKRLELILVCTLTSSPSGSTPIGSTSTPVQFESTSTWSS